MERIENISFRRRERLSTTQIAAAAIIVFSTLKLMAEPLPAIKKDLKEASASYCYGANMVNHMKNPDYRTLEIPKEIQVAWTEIRNIKAEDPKSLWEGIKRLGDRNKEIDYCAKFAEE
ncbi:MAG: hypothetical protein QW112_01095, partial [Candidatus Micrarchaeia archaeon]